MIDGLLQPLALLVEHHGCYGTQGLTLLVFLDRLRVASGLLARRYSSLLSWVDAYFGEFAGSLAILRLTAGCWRAAC